MSKKIKIKQSDIEKIVSKIVSENINNLKEIDSNEEGEGLELHLGLTPEGGYVLYKRNLDGTDEVVKKFDK